MTKLLALLAAAALTASPALACQQLSEKGNEGPPPALDALSAKTAAQAKAESEAAPAAKHDHTKHEHAPKK